MLFKWTFLFLISDLLVLFPIKQVVIASEIVSCICHKGKLLVSERYCSIILLLLSNEIHTISSCSSVWGSWSYLQKLIMINIITDNCECLYQRSVYSNCQSDVSNVKVRESETLILMSFSSRIFYEIYKFFGLLTRFW